jgi:hypothetical protein
MPRRPIAVLVLVLLAVLLGCWLWLGRKQPSPLAPGVEPNGLAPDSPSAPVSAPPVEDSRSAAPGAGSDRHFRPDSTRVEGRHELLVQLRDGGEPLAGVEVFALALSNSDWSIGGTRGPLLTNDLEGYLAEHGRKQLTDAQGIALVPEPDETLVVCARKDALWGWTSFERGASEPAVLELAPAHDLDVIVRGADGAPQAGARVQLARIEDPTAMWVAATGADGTLRVRNVEALLADQGLQSGELARIALLEPFVSPIERWIDPRVLPSEPIELVLPACGSLRVRVVGKPGLPLPVDGDVRLRWTARSAAVQSLLPGRESIVVLPLVDGEGSVPHVALGGRLAVAAIFAGGCQVEREIEGPRFPGEELTVQLEIDSRDCLLLLPVLDEQGQPLALRELEFARYVLRPDRGRIFFAARERLRTDAQGRLRCVLSRESQIDTGGEPSERIGWLWLARAGQPALAAEVDLRGPFAPGLNERPPVVLKPDAPLAQGRVIDEQDKPVPNVTVALNRIAMGSPGEIPGLAPVRTDAGGEFEFHGPCLSFDLQLEAFAADHRMPPGEKPPLFRCGTSPSFEIRMQLLGRLRGRVLTDPAVGAGDLALRVERGGAAQSVRQVRRLGNGFAIEFDGLAEGEYTLIASSPRDQQVFASIAGLSVKAGETCRDARLDPLDLRGRVPVEAPEGPTVEIRILDEQGRELDHGFAWLGPARRTWAGGRIALPADARGELAVVAPHTGIGRITLDGQPAEIHLPPALHALFALELPADLHASGVGFGLQLGLADWSDPLSEDLFERGEWLELNAAGELAIELPAAAELDGSLTARLPAASGGGPLPLPLVAHGHWQVRATDGEQRFVIEARPEAWERLRSALEQRR